MIQTRDLLFRSILESVREFAHGRPDWVFEVLAFHEQSGRLSDALRRLDVSGVIGCFDEGPTVRALRRAGIPLVCITNGQVSAPAVGLDERSNTRLVAEHFLSRGLRRFAFLSTRDDRLTAVRLSGFRQTLAEAGCTCNAKVFHESEPREWPGTSPGMQRRIVQWVRTLEPPVGLLATKDDGGLAAVYACREAGLRVPEDVSIVGLQHDDILCQFANPSVSSVRTAAHRLGYEAAALLDRLLTGKPVPDRHVLLPPEGITVRQSSDVFAVHDPLLAKALRHIADNAHRGLRVADLLRVVPLSRRGLEQKFRNALGRTPGQEIRRVRTELAKDLLRQTDLPVGEVAERAGFSDLARLDHTFRRDLGLSPRQYRRQQRHGL